MNSKKRYLALRMFSIAVAAVVCCGCPPEKNLQVQVLDGYWALTTFNDDGTINNKSGLKLFPDGTVAVYTQSDNPVPDSTWDQVGNSFTYKNATHTFNAAVANPDFLEGFVFANSDLSTPVLSFNMRFVSADVFGLPRVSEGHWRFVTADLVNGLNEYGAKLNANGTVEESPAGDPFFPPDEAVGFWSENHGEFRLEFYDKNNALLLRLVTTVDAPNFLEGPFGIQGEFAAERDPTIVVVDGPPDQAPIG